MTALERKNLLEEEKRVYIANQTLLRAFVKKLPDLRQMDIDFHMKACSEYLDKCGDIYIDGSPFALRFDKPEVKR